ncbi:MAG: type II toxin-antitoxin system Phd/YefM family antitoxin [Thermoanaerobaculia bacterium]
MRELSIREMRAELGRLGQLLETEEQLVITRHGRPIARVLPLGPRRGRPSHADLRASMPRLATGSEVAVRADRDQL